MKNIIVLIVAFALMAPIPALAQSVPVAQVVPICGTQVYPAGTARPVTQDVTGVQCAGGTSGGGGAGGVLGYQQISSATLAVATIPTVPTGTIYIDIEPEGSSGTNNVCVRWRDDGSAPTASVGNPQAPLQNYLGVLADLTKIQFIAATGATCTLNLRYTK